MLFLEILMPWNVTLTPKLPNKIFFCTLMSVLISNDPMIDEIECPPIYNYISRHCVKLYCIIMDRRFHYESFK